MKTLATALVGLALVALVGPPAHAAPLSESVSGATSSQVRAAVPPADPDASGAIIRDESCFDHQLGGGEPWASVSAERVELPFTVQSNGKYWDDIWISPQGALSHDEGGILAVGFDVDDEDLIRASEVYAPMLAGSSVTSWWNMDDPESPEFGQHLSPVYYGYTIFEGHQALCVTWLDVVPQVPVGSPEWVVNEWYPAGGNWTQAFDWDPSRRNSFQVLLVDRSATGFGNFDTVYNYDTIEWQVEQNALDSTTGGLLSNYAEAGWSLGVPSYDPSHMWRGYVDGRRDPDGNLNADPQLPYPEDHWFPQHDANGDRETYLDSSPTGLAVTSTNASQLGRHVFPIRGPRWHLALVLDGSSSLTPEEYAAEVDAIVAGLDDDDAFPPDGRFGISVTVTGRYVDPATYDDVDALTVIPEMTIFSPATMVTLQAWIRSIPQSTSPGGSDRVGLSVGVTDTESFQSRNGLRSVCQVSFAQPSAGLGSELDSLGSTGAVDRVDLVGIGGHVGGNTGSSSSELDVEEQLFGGNGYVYVPSAEELADQWVGHCSERFPLIRGIEVTQAIQNLPNDVPLVAGKAAVARVYVEKVFRDDPDRTFTASLTLKRLGTPGAPIAQSTRNPVEGSITIPFDALASRTSGRYTLEYSMPMDWLSEPGLLSLTANETVTCTYARVDDWSAVPYCGVEVDPVVVNPIPLRVYRIEGTLASYDFDRALPSHLGDLRTPLPLPSFDVEVDELNLDDYAANCAEAGIAEEEREDWVLCTLQRKIERERMEGGDVYGFDFVLDSYEDSRAIFPGGASPLGSHMGWVNVFYATRETWPHEFGHGIGLNHAIALPSEPADSGYSLGACGALVDSDVPDWPFRARVSTPNGAIETPVISGFGYFWSVPGSTPRDEFWGFDTRIAGLDPGISVPPSGYANALAPWKTGELMSYVNNSENPYCDIGSQRWSSPITYGRFLAQFGDTWDVWRHLAEALQNWDGATQVRSILGVVNLESATVVFDSGFDVPDLGMQFGNDDGYELLLYDGDGTLLATISPDIAPLVSDGEGAPATIAFFSGTYSQPNVQRIVMARDGAELGSVSASGNSPSVTIVSPTDGALLDEDTVVIEWAGQDADGDPLTYNVWYAPDGLDWTMLASGLSQDSYTLDRSRIAGSSQGAIRVEVADGFLSGRDEISGLSVSGNAPTIVVASPVDGGRTWGDLPLRLEAYSWDKEDGATPADEVSWESSIDGVIRDGGYLSARDLTPGTHTIAASYTDSDGNTSTDSVTIQVFAEQPPDVAVDPSAPATPLAHNSRGATTSEPSPSPSASPEPIPSAGVDETPGVEPSPTPSPGATASDPREPSSSAWVWLIGLVLLVSAAAVGGLWFRQRLVREP